MKPRAKKPETVFRVIHRESGRAMNVYSRAYGDEFDFESPAEARSANCFDLFADKSQYAIAQYRVTYELIDPDVDKE